MWQRLGDKTMRPFAIVLQSGEPYAFAGLWETWQPPEGALLETFTILTTAPNSLTEPIHDRMPVIVEPKDYDRWMDPSTAPPLDLLRPYPQRRCGRDGFRLDVKSHGRRRPGPAPSRIPADCWVVQDPRLHRNCTRRQWPFTALRRPFKRSRHSASESNR